MEKIIIAAVSKNGFIGNDGKIPWNCKAEITHFKKTTSGYPIIMGRKTWEAIGSPLKNRVNIVISKTLKKKKTEKDFFIFTSIKKAFLFCESLKVHKCFIIGGEQIFNASLKSVDKLIVSVMKFETVGDARFPRIKKSDWQEINCEDFNEFAIHTYNRKK